MLHNDPALFDLAHALLLRMLPDLEAIVSGRQVFLTAGDVAEIDAVLGAIEMHASRRCGEPLSSRPQIWYYIGAVWGGN